MAKLGILLCTTTIFGLALAGLQPASAQNSPNMPNIRPPDISSTRPDFSRPGGLPGAARDIAPADRFGHAESTVRDAAKKKASKNKVKNKVKSAARGNVGAGAGTNVNAPAIAGQDAAGLTPNQLAPVERLRAYLDGIGNAEEIQRMRNLVDGLIKGEGSWAKVIAGAGAGLLSGGVQHQAANPKGDLLGAQTATPKGSDQSSASDDRQFPPASANTGDGRAGGSNDYADNQRQPPPVGGRWGPGDARDRTGLNDPSGQASDGGNSSGFGYAYWESGQQPRTSRRPRDPEGTTNESSFVRQDMFDKDGRRSGRYSETERTVREVPNGDGTVNRTTFYTEQVFSDDGTLVSSNDKVFVEENVPPQNPPDPVNPAPEGTSRPSGGGAAVVTAWFGGRTVRCDFFGCVETSTSSKRDDPRIGRNPDGMSTGFVAGGSAGPGAATDPCPDCGPGGTGGGGGFKPPGPGGDPINPNVEGSGSGVGPPSPR